MLIEIYTNIDFSSLLIQIADIFVEMKDKQDVWKNFTPEPGRLHNSFEYKKLLLPELGILGWLRFTKAFGQALEADSHEDEYEIHYIVNGELNWWVEERDYTLRSGTILIVRPNERHGSRSGALEPCEHFWLRISMHLDKQLPGLSEEQNRNLCKAFASFESRVFMVSPMIHTAFSKLVQEHHTPDIHSETTSRASLHSLLVTIIRDYEKTRDKSKGFEISSCIEASTLRIKENLSNPPTVKQLSREAQISEAGFRKKFRMEIGCSPLDYINRRRIDEAKRLMSLGHPNIKEISHNLGFSSRQYFSTVFKRVTGMSPGDLIKRASQ